MGARFSITLCTTADCGRVATQLVFVEEAEPPDWFDYCEQCAALVGAEPEYTPVHPDDPIVHGARWRRERDRYREALDKPLRETILAVLRTMPSEAAPEHLAAQIEIQVRAWQALSSEAGKQ